MLFAERPITVQHIRQFCENFGEGLRVEYKSTFDQNVREKLPKVISSFANSQGGVLVVGVSTENGIPRPPFEGFRPPEREELGLTIENICLRNIYPPLLPRITPLPSDVDGLTFLVIEVDESGEAPHAIENSRRVYVRTGNAANPYDLADVDLILDLVKRRTKSLDLRRRLLANADERSRQIVDQGSPRFLISICPTYPRSELMPSEDVWTFVTQAQGAFAYLVPPNSLRRVPDGVASLVASNPQGTSPHYFELNKYGMASASKLFRHCPWVQGAPPHQLLFGDLVRTILNQMICADRFYSDRGYRGTVFLDASLRNVQNKPMLFREPDPFGDNTGDFRCYSDTVCAERPINAEELHVRRFDILADILAELTWSFWQGNGDYPRAALETLLRRYVKE